MKTTEVIETLKIIRENASCDNCLYGYDSIEDCEFVGGVCPVDKALEAGTKMSEIYYNMRKGLARTANFYKDFVNRNTN